MIIEIKVPVLAESVPDATLLDWYKQVGEQVTRGENLIDLETDKVTLEIEAPESGVIKELCKQTGDVVLTDDILAVIDTDGAATVSAEAPAAAPQPEALAPDGAASEKLSPRCANFSTNAASMRAASKAPARVGVWSRPTCSLISKRAVMRPPSSPRRPRWKNDPHPSRPCGGRARADDSLAETHGRTPAHCATRSRALNHHSMKSTCSPSWICATASRRNSKSASARRLGFMSFFVKAAVEALKKFPRRKRPTSMVTTSSITDSLTSVSRLAPNAAWSFRSCATSNTCPLPKSNARSGISAHGRVMANSRSMN